MKPEVSPRPATRLARLGSTALGLALSAWGGPALAYQSATGTTSATAFLDFEINIDKFIFFRVGTGAFPSASGTVDTVNFTLTPQIPPGPITPANGNSTALSWNAAAPTYNVGGSNLVLPVEVRSNAGTVSLRAAVTSALVSGANSIPLSQITIASSDANLPAPLIPNAGTGPAVNVTGTAFSNLVTVRSANWTFSYSAATAPRAGVYNGQITFTASAP